jgi:hypothetical protein
MLRNAEPPKAPRPQFPQTGGTSLWAAPILPPPKSNGCSLPEANHRSIVRIAAVNYHGLSRNRIEMDSQHHSALSIASRVTSGLGVPRRAWTELWAGGSNGTKPRPNTDYNAKRQDAEGISSPAVRTRSIARITRLAKGERTGFNGR